MFIGNSKSKIYHRPSCFNCPKDERRRVSFDTRADATAAGFKPCGMCKSDRGGNNNMQSVSEAVETATNLTITTETRTALWRDSNTGSGTVSYLPAGTYVVLEVRNGFSRIEGGWLHRLPEPKVECVPEAPETPSDEF